MLAPAAVHVTVGGEQTAAAASVTQRVEVLKAKGAPRMKRLCELLRESLGSAAPPEADDEEAEGEGEEEGGGQEAAGSGEVADGETAAVAEAAVEIAAAGAAAAAAGAAERPQVIVFCVFKKQAKALGKWLAGKGFPVATLHGDLSQGAREHAIQRFRAAEARVLVATDVAARGLDVPNVSAVINFSLGGSIDHYVHRVGRCG